MPLTAAKRLMALFLIAALAILMTHASAWSDEPAKADGDAAAQSAPAKPAAEGTEAAKPSPAPAPQKPAVEKVPPLEEFLTRAMANHPDIAAARAKVELAEAELRQTEHRVASELTDLQTTWAAQTANVEMLNARWNSGQLSATEMVEMVAARGKLAETEARAKLLLHQKPLAPHALQADPCPTKPESPKGPVVEKIRKALNQETSLDFDELPLEEVMKSLTETYNVNFLLDASGLEEQGFAIDSPVTIHIANVPLGAALQAMEDSSRRRFVLRDYGIVYTTPTLPLADVSVSAVKFWEESLQEPPAPAAK